MQQASLIQFPFTHFKLRMSLILVLLPHLFRKSPLLLAGSYQKSRESRSSESLQNQQITQCFCFGTKTYILDVFIILVIDEIYYSILSYISFLMRVWTVFNMFKGTCFVNCLFISFAYSSIKFLVLCPSMSKRFFKNIRTTNSFSLTYVTNSAC